MISGFRREADTNCVLLGYCTASNGNSLPTFRDKISVPTGCPEMSVRNYHYSLWNNPEERTFLVIVKFQASKHPPLATSPHPAGTSASSANPATGQRLGSAFIFSYRQRILKFTQFTLVYYTYRALMGKTLKNRLRFILWWHHSMDTAAGHLLAGWLWWTSQRPHLVTKLAAMGSQITSYIAVLGCK